MPSWEEIKHSYLTGNDTKQFQVLGFIKTVVSHRTIYMLSGISN